MLRQAERTDGMRYHDERLRWLQENFSYIDSVTMIDATGKITVKERYNPRYSDAENAADNEWCLNRNLLEVFPSLSHSDSTLLQALQKGELLYRENQCTINHSGKKSVTNNVTFPIISRGKIIGAVELSRDVTHYEGERTAPAARPTPKRRSGTEAKWTLEDIVTQNSKMRRQAHHCQGGGQPLLGAGVRPRRARERSSSSRRCTMPAAARISPLWR